MSGQIHYKQYTDEQIQQIHDTLLMMLKDFDIFCKKHDIQYFGVAGTLLGAVRHQGYIPWDDDLDIAILRKDYYKLLAYKDELREKYTIYSPECDDKYYNFVPILSLNHTKWVVPLAKDVFEPGILIDIFIYENIPDDPKEAQDFINKTYFYRNLYVMSRANFSLLVPGSTAVQKVKYGISRVSRFVMDRIDKEGNIFRKKYLDLVNRYEGKTSSYSLLADPYSKELSFTYDDIFPLKTLRFEDFDLPVQNNYEKWLINRYGDYMKLPPEEQRVNHCPYKMELLEDKHERV